MADQNHEVYQVSVDTKQFVDGIRAALNAYTTFAKGVQRELRVRLNEDQIQRFAKLIGKEFQVVAKEMAAASTASKGVATGISQIAQAATKSKGAVKSLADQIKGTAQDVIEINGQIGRITDQQARAAETALARLRRAQALIKDQSKLGTTSIAESKAQDLLAFNRARKEGQLGTFSVDNSLVDRLRAQTAAVLREERKVAREKEQTRANELKIAEAAEAALADAARKRASAEKDKSEFLKSMEAEIVSGIMSEVKAQDEAKKAEDRRIANMERAIRVARELNEIRTKAGIFDVQRPPEHFIAPDGKFDSAAANSAQRSATGDVKANAQFMLKAQRDAVKSQQDQIRQGRILNQQNAQALEQHTGINLKLIEQGVRLAKFIVYYRIIQDSLRGIETAVKAVVSAGIEYTKNVETQRLGLIGILSENYKVRDTQKNLLSGATLYSRLQGESVRQWAELQKSSLAVVGTTEDLMGLYEGVLPFAAKLGKNLEEVQQMTKATAIAASLMNISFSDARTAIISLLQGRALTKNRLVSVLGFSDADIKRLKGTPQLFDEIMKRLDGFGGLAKDASQTVAALNETFKELVGLVGSRFVSPFLEEFRRFMGDATSGKGLMGALFEGDDTNGLQLKASVSNFFRFVKSAVSDTIEPVRQFGAELSGGQDKAYVLAQGVANMAQAFVQLSVWVSKAVIAVTQFVAQNSGLIKFFAGLGSIAVATNLMNNFGKKVIDVVQRVAVFKTAAEAAATATKAVAAAETAATASTAALTTGTTLMAGGLATLATLTFTYLIGKVLEYKRSLDDAKRSQDLFRAGKPVEAVAAQAGNRERGDIKAFKSFTQADLDLKAKAADLRKDPLLGRLELDGRNALEIHKELHAQELANNRLIAEGKGLSAEAIQQLHEKNLLIAEARQKLEEWNAAIHDNAAAGIASVTEEIAKLEREVEDANASKAQTKRLFGEHVPSTFVDQDNNLTNTIAANTEKLRVLKQERQVLFASLQGTQDSQRKFTVNNQLTFEPNKADNTEEIKSRKPFHSAADDRLRTEEIYYNTRLKILQSAHSNELISDETFDQQSEDLERAHLERSLDLLKEKQDEYNAEIAKYKGTKREYTADEIENITRDIDNQRREIEAQIEVASRQREDRDKARQQRIATLSKETAESISAELNGIFGFADEKLSDTLNKMADQIQKTFHNQNKDLLGKQFADQLRAAIPSAENFKATGIAIDNLKLKIQDLQAAQQDLDLGYQTGRISLDRYLNATRDNRREQIKALETMRGLIIAQRDAAAAFKGLAPDDPKLQQFNNDIAEITRQLGVLRAAAGTAAQAVDTLVSAVSQFQDIGDFFAYANEGLGKFIGGVGSVIGMAGKIANIPKVLGSIKTAFKNIIPDGKTFNFKNFLGAFGIGKAGSTLAAVTGGISLGVTAVFGIASAIFRHNVEKAKKDIEKGAKDIADAVSHGGITIGVGLDKLQKLRADMVAKYSKSKSGRKALKEELPEIDKQIDDMKQRIEEIKKNFEDTLKGLRAGNGPFGDFARQLIDLKKTTDEYLAAFNPANTAEYANALANVTEMYNLTLKNLREGLQEQQRGFEQTAIQAQLRVLDLEDQHTELLQQQADLADQQLQIEKDRAELVKDEQKHLKEIAETKKELSVDLPREEAKHVKEIADARQRILDIQREAADQEAAIRRRGILEGQLTVSQQRLIDIAKVRHDAAKDVDDAKERLRELLDDTSLQERKIELQEHLKELLEDTSLQEKAADIDKRQRQLGLQRDKIAQQLTLNGIELSGAREVARIEGEVFGLTQDRVQLAQRNKDLEIEAAQAQVRKWNETRRLVDSIIDSAGGILFTPPPGFPQIRVQIGDIYVNNQDYSQTQYQVPRGPDTPNPFGNGLGGGYGYGYDPGAFDDDERRYPNLGE